MPEYKSMLAACLALVLAQPALGQEPAAPNQGVLSYADLVDLSDNAKLVIHAQIRKQTLLEPARAPGLAPG